MGKLVIDGNSVYEIDEECIRRKECQENQQELQMAGRRGKGTGMERRAGRKVNQRPSNNMDRNRQWNF